MNNSPSELEKDFKPINISLDDMEKFEEKERTKERTFAKKTWYNRYNWLINYIPDPIKNSGWC